MCLKQNIAKKSGAKIFSIVNLLTSTLVQESTLVMGMNCGPEIGVAATKSFCHYLQKITEKLCDVKLLSNFWSTVDY